MRSGPNDGPPQVIIVDTERVRLIARRHTITKLLSNGAVTSVDIESAIRESCDELFLEIEDACRHVLGKSDDVAEASLRVRGISDLMAAIRALWPLPNVVAAVPASGRHRGPKTKQRRSRKILEH